MRQDEGRTVVQAKRAGRVSAEKKSTRLRLVYDRGRQAIVQLFKREMEDFKEKLGAPLEGVNNSE